MRRAMCFAIPAAQQTILKPAQPSALPANYKPQQAPTTIGVRG